MREGAETVSRRSTENKESHHREYQQVKLKSLALLSAGPVHKKAETMMYSQNCDQHVYTDSERRDSGQESEDEPDPPEELGSDGQEGQWSWNMRHASEEIHRSGESEASEPTQHLLRTVREEDNTQHQSQNRRGDAVIRGI